jgi:single-strand DNA-binding protein
MSDQITVVGTVVNDPEQRRTSGGHTVINFRMACNARRRDETTGAWIDGHTNWYSVSAYRALAEHALASVRKGHRVFVTGSFRLREWEANGRQGVAAEIDATSLGHDLLWGTTVYTRSDGGAQPAAAASVAKTPEPGADRDVADAWNAYAPDAATPF